MYNSGYGIGARVQRPSGPLNTGNAPLVWRRQPMACPVPPFTKFEFEPVGTSIAWRKGGQSYAVRDKARMEMTPLALESEEPWIAAFLTRASRRKVIEAFGLSENSKAIGCSHVLLRAPKDPNHDPRLDARVGSKVEVFGTHYAEDDWSQSLLVRFMNDEEIAEILADGGSGGRSFLAISAAGFGQPEDRAYSEYGRELCAANGVGLSYVSTLWRRLDEELARDGNASGKRRLKPFQGRESLLQSTRAKVCHLLQEGRPLRLQADIKRSDDCQYVVIEGCRCYGEEGDEITVEEAEATVIAADCVVESTPASYFSKAIQDQSKLVESLKAFLVEDLRKQGKEIAWFSRDPATGWRSFACVTATPERKAAIGLPEFEPLAYEGVLIREKNTAPLSRQEPVSVPAVLQRDEMEAMYHVASVSDILPPPTNSALLELFKAPDGTVSVLHVRPGRMRPELPEAAVTFPELRYTAEWYAHRILLQAEASKGPPPVPPEDWTFPVLLLITRCVDDAEAYKHAWAEGSKSSMEAHSEDLKCCVTFVDSNDPNLFHELIMANKPEAVVHVQSWFFQLPGMPGIAGGQLLHEYKFGHDRPVKYGESDRQGFIKEHSGVEGPPVIAITTRFAKEGRRAEIFEGQAVVSRVEKYKLPSLMASCSIPAEFTDDVNAVWDLSVMGDWDCCEDRQEFCSEAYDPNKPAQGFVIADNPANLLPPQSELQRYTWGTNMTGEVGSFK